MRELESALAGWPFQQQVTNRQDALVVPKVGYPFVKRVQVAGISERKCGQQLKVTPIARRFHLNKLLELAVRAHALVMPRCVVVNELFLEFPKGGVQFSAAFSVYQIVWGIQKE